MSYQPEFYSSKPWRAFRRRFLLAHPMCSVDGCGQAATYLDHVEARRAGGHDFGHVQRLCPSHHAAKTVASDRGFGRAPIADYKPQVRGCAVNGTPNAPDHPLNQAR